MLCIYQPGTSDDKQPLIPEEEEDLGYGLTVVGRAEFPDQDEQIRKEDEIYFYPESRESKIDIVRFLINCISA